MKKLEAKKLWVIAFILAATSLPSVVMYGLNPYLGNPAPLLIIIFSVALAAAFNFANPEESSRVRQITMGTALLVGYALSVYGSRLGLSMGFNTLTTVVLAPFVIGTLEDWRQRYAGYALSGALGIYIAYALNQLIVQEVTF